MHITGNGMHITGNGMHITGYDMDRTRQEEHLCPQVLEDVRLEWEGAQTAGGRLPGQQEVRRRVERHSDGCVDLPPDEPATGGPRRRIVIHHPRAQLLLHSSVQALDAALRLGVARLPVHDHRPRP